MSDPAVERVRATVGADVTVDDLRRGEQADLTILRSGDRRYVLKRFSSRHHGSRADSLDAEAAVLRLLGASQPPRGVRVPTVLAEYPEEFAYLMSFEAGEPAERVEGLDAPRTASLLVDGLTWYHGCTGRIYGDFQPGNVLVDDEASVVLLDPTSPSAIFERVAERVGDMLAADVGYWVFTVSTRSFKRVAVDRPAGRRSAMLARELVRAAASRAGDGFDRRVLAAARAHAAWLARRQPLKLPIAAAVPFIARRLVRS